MKQMYLSESIVCLYAYEMWITQLSSFGIVVISSNHAIVNKRFSFYILFMSSFDTLFMQCIHQAPLTADWLTKKTNGVLFRWLVIMRLFWHAAKKLNMRITPKSFVCHVFLSPQPSAPLLFIFSCFIFFVSLLLLINRVIFHIAYRNRTVNRFGYEPNANITCFSLSWRPICIRKNIYRMQINVCASHIVSLMCRQILPGCGEEQFFSSCCLIKRNSSVLHLFASDYDTDVWHQIIINMCAGNVCDRKIVRKFI